MDQPRLENTGRGLTVYWKRYLYSQHDPLRRPQSAAEAAHICECCLYLLPSPLLGYGMDVLLDRIPESSHLIAFEISQELFKLCSPYIPKALLKRSNISLVRLSDQNSLLSVIHSIGLWRFRRIQRVDLNAGAALHSKNYGELVQTAGDALIAYWRNRHAMHQLGRHWVRHLYANLAMENNTLPMPITHKPIVAVGAGPRSEQILPYLMKRRKDISIWATDTALGMLLKVGIKPDCVCILETQAWNHLDFHGSAHTQIPLFADITSYPMTLQWTNGPVHLFSSEFANLHFLHQMQNESPDIERIPPLGSVGLATVYLALKYSTGTVFLAGLDCCYKPGKTHARGTAVHVWQLANINRTDPHPGWETTMRRQRCTIAGYRNNTLNTDSVLAGYATLFQQRFGGNNRLYSLTDGADLGVPLISQNEADAYIQKNLENVVEVHAAPSYNVGTERRRFLQDQINKLNHAITRWDEFVEGAKNAQDVAEALRDLDQVYCDFPDKPPLPSTNQSFLVRAITRCRQLKKYITRITENTF